MGWTTTILQLANTLQAQDAVILRHAVKSAAITTGPAMLLPVLVASGIVVLISMILVPVSALIVYGWVTRLVHTIYLSKHPSWKVILVNYWVLPISQHG